MPVQITCPSCNRQLKVPDNLVGQMVKCPGCQNTFRAPVEEGPAVPPPLPPQEEPTQTRRPARDDEERYQEEVPRPTRPPSRRDDDDDDDLDDDRGPRRRRSRDYAPHRGGMILAFGILGWAVCFIFGVIAWIMGNSDMKEIRAGRMDPAGESMTNIGRILGMIQCILIGVILIVYCFIAIIAAATGKL